MPRTGRGGRRTGTPGKAYSNRTDLNERSNVVPMMAAKGQAYGSNKAQMDAQRALPVAAPPPPAIAGPVAPSPAPGPAPAVTPLGAPTARPGEPVTAGAPVGPGPGVAALGLPDENGVEDLARYLPMLEFIASQPGASVQTRNFVRRLRGAAPIPKVM